MHATPQRQMLQLKRASVASFLKDPQKRLLDHVKHLSQKAENVVETESPTTDPHGVDEKVHKEPIGEDEDEENAKVSPLLTRVDVQAREV